LYADFTAQYPDAKVSKLDGDDQWRSLCESVPNWFRGGNGKDPRAVRVMNYYYSERESKTLYHLSNGAAVYADEKEHLPPGVTVMKDEDGGEQSHTETGKQWYWCKLVGNEVLERTEWPGRWMPIIEEVGEELQPYDQERRFQGVVRPMRDSCRANYRQQVCGRVA
jgi:hypothetical protein